MSVNNFHMEIGMDDLYIKIGTSEVFDSYGASGVSLLGHLFKLNLKIV